MPSTTLTLPVAAANVPSVTLSGRMRASHGTCAATQSRIESAFTPFAR